jgi:hypothetical protein
MVGKSSNGPLNPPLMLEPEESPMAETLMAETGPPPRRQYRWYDKLLALVGVILLFEIGVFLLVFPWASEWGSNYFSRLPFWARDIWISHYFRGAISGLGIIDIYISFVEVFRLRRFSG